MSGRVATAMTGESVYELRCNYRTVITGVNWGDGRVDLFQGL